MSTTGPTSTRRRRAPGAGSAALDGIGLLARLFLGIVLVVAGIAKVGRPLTAERAVQAYEILPMQLAGSVGLALPFLEIVLGRPSRPGPVHPARRRRVDPAHGGLRHRDLAGLGPGPDHRLRLLRWRRSDGRERRRTLRRSPATRASPRRVSGCGGGPGPSPPSTASSSRTERPSHHGQALPMAKRSDPAERPPGQDPGGAEERRRRRQQDRHRDGRPRRRHHRGRRGVIWTQSSARRSHRRRTALPAGVTAIGGGLPAFEDVTPQPARPRSTSTRTSSARRASSSRSSPARPSRTSRRRAGSCSSTT